SIARSCSEAHCWRCWPTTGGRPNRTAKPREPQVRDSFHADTAFVSPDFTSIKPTGEAGRAPTWLDGRAAIVTGAGRGIGRAAPLLRGAAKRESAERGEARARKIVNISSTSATRGNFGQANYAAAKAGVIGLTRALAREWGPFNIQVNAVAFGLIDTRLTRGKESGERIRRGEAEINLGIPTAMREAAIK